MNEIKVGSDGFIKLVDSMGNDASIVQAARVSYGTGTKSISDDRNLIRYLYRHGHGTPFEMVEFKFLVRCPMDIWRQWIRHRTANVNEYSTRYSEAIDECAKTIDWRKQSTVNKQGGAELVNEWPEGFELPKYFHADFRKQLQEGGPSAYLSDREQRVQTIAREVYEERLVFGVAREQARKDLPLSNYTEAYWKCDLRNILGFLSLRMDSHAQQEIRDFAEAMYTLVKQVCPVAVEAFDEYDQRRGGLLLTATEIKIIQALKPFVLATKADVLQVMSSVAQWPLPPAKCRERDEAMDKFQRLGLITKMLLRKEEDADREPVCVS